MTDPETPATPKTGRSPGVTAAIIIAIVVVLAGGAFVVYKLTDKKDAPEAAALVARRATAAVASGNSATLRSISTGGGTAQLLTLKPGDVNGFKVTFASCKPVAGKTPTRLCTATRPGGQLGLSLVLVDGAWKINSAIVGPAGLPPTSTTTVAT